MGALNLCVILLWACHPLLVVCRYYERRHCKFLRCDLPFFSYRYKKASITILTFCIHIHCGDDTWLCIIPHEYSTFPYSIINKKLLLRIVNTVFCFMWYTILETLRVSTTSWWLQIQHKAMKNCILTHFCTPETPSIQARENNSLWHKQSSCIINQQWTKKKVDKDYIQIFGHSYILYQNNSIHRLRTQKITANLISTV